jgi:hypothetical protein
VFERRSRNVQPLTSPVAQTIPRSNRSALLHVQNLYKAFSAIRVATGRLSRIKWHRYERTLLTFRFLAVCLKGSIKFSDNEERLKVGIADL